MFNVFVSTKLSQGFRKNDFSFAAEDELVMFASECDGEKVDGKCGCRRSMTGFWSRKGTTTFRVSVYSGTREAYVKEFMSSLKGSGWTFPDEDIVAMADELLDLAAKFNVGSLLEKRGNFIFPRVVPS